MDTAKALHPLKQRMTVEWDAVGFVISSRYRVAIVETLADESATPTVIASAAEVSTTHISRALRQLRDRSIVTLTVPENQQKGRVYELTDFGRQIWKTVSSNRLIASK